MEHPFIDTVALAEKSLEDLQETIAQLATKLNFAYRTSNGPLINQLAMALDSYRTVYGRKMDELMKKQLSQTKISIQKDSQ